MIGFRYVLAVGALAIPMAANAAGLASLSAPSPSQAAFNWGGFYVGAHVGGGWMGDSNKIYNGSGALTATDASHGAGVFGGGQVGYNWVLPSNILIGGEADVSGGGVNGSVTGCTTTGCALSHSHDDVFGTLRGRVGFVASNLLLYGTGGLAWMENNATRTLVCIGPNCPAVSTKSVLLGQSDSASGGEIGWSAGAGAEYALNEHWTTGLQYLHLQFDGVSRSYSYSLPTAFRSVKSNDAVDTIALAVNYKF